ncbi:hypothetical protein NEFER03_1081 [Nematocida sp. LUAm3]|nr:hypothetical protein NEFER03_1081 [Nematocida sp. LUAm3]KAI5175314.1 hypothetical protein NEFER02_1243 [Nematocida sp. LUAm2]KAI5177729.1 hypothetical protein NEFER01_0953 [Nematocida sp. LUAm1]
MRTLTLVILSAASAFGYMDMDTREMHMPESFRSFFLVKKILPRRMAMQERPFPMGANRRLDSEEKYSPFSSMLIVRKRRPDSSINSFLKRTETPDSFIKDFLSTHLRHMHLLYHELPSHMLSEEMPKQFNTERIYRDLVQNHKIPKNLKRKGVIREADDSKLLFKDEIETIMSQDQNDSQSEPSESSLEKRGDSKKTFRRVKRRVKKNFHKARRQLGKGIKVSFFTIILFVIVAFISAYIGYSMNKRSPAENYVPLPK